MDNQRVCKSHSSEYFLVYPAISALGGIMEEPAYFCVRK